MPTVPISDSERLRQACPATHERMLQAAHAVFLQEGYRVSMDKVAAQAGVAKQTLYAHFGSKEQLFAAVIRRSAQSLAASLDGPSADLRDALLRFAHALRGCVLSAEGIALHRALIAEAPRFPDLARLLYDGSLRGTLERVAGLLAQAMERGDLRRGDPAFAAEMLVNLLTGLERTRRLLGVVPADAPLDHPAAEQAVDCFLHAYRPLPGPRLNGNSFHD